MNWRNYEDVICCEVCVYEYVIKKESTDINTVINRIKQHASIHQREYGSIRERIQNIKACLERLSVENTIPIVGLENYAKQTEDVLQICLKNANVL